MYGINTHLLQDVRCPSCHVTDRFVVQMTMNVYVEDDGVDFMESPPPDDTFPEKPVDSGPDFADDTLISCAGRNGCGHSGTVGEFKTVSRQD